MKRGIYVMKRGTYNEGKCAFVVGEVIRGEEGIDEKGIGTLLERKKGTYHC